jgi:hypothetical protein
MLLFLFRPAPGQAYAGAVFAVRIDALATRGQVLNTVVTIADPEGRVQPSNSIPVRLTAVPEPSALIYVASASVVALPVGLWRLRCRTPESGLPIC